MANFKFVTFLHLTNADQTGLRKSIHVPIFFKMSEFIYLRYRISPQYLMIILIDP